MKDENARHYTLDVQLVEGALQFGISSWEGPIIICMSIGDKTVRSEVVLAKLESYYISHAITWNVIVAE
jgi:hypothetical protein